MLSRSIYSVIDTAKQLKALQRGKRGGGLSKFQNPNLKLWKSHVTNEQYKTKFQIVQ